MGLYEDIGSRLRTIRGKRTQEQFVEELDLLKGMKRSSYSMIEIGKRPANLFLLDMVSAQEDVSLDYIFGKVDCRVNLYEERYHQLLSAWSDATNKEKDLILQYANQVIRRRKKDVN